MRRVELSHAAERNLSDAIAHIAREDPDAADRVAARLREAAGQLAAFPELGAIHGPRGRRILTVAGTPFRLIYRAEPARLILLRIWHGARGWPPLA